MNKYIRDNIITTTSGKREVVKITPERERKFQKNVSEKLYIWDGNHVNAKFMREEIKEISKNSVEEGAYIAPNNLFNGGCGWSFIAVAYIKQNYLYLLEENYGPCCKINLTTWEIEKEGNPPIKEIIPQKWDIITGKNDFPDEEPWKLKNNKDLVYISWPENPIGTYVYSVNLLSDEHWVKEIRNRVINGKDIEYVNYYKFNSAHDAKEWAKQEYPNTLKEYYKDRSVEFHKKKFCYDVVITLFPDSSWIAYNGGCSANPESWRDSATEIVEYVRELEKEGKISIPQEYDDNFKFQGREISSQHFMAMEDIWLLPR